MKTEKIIWGLVLVFIGTILLLQNLDIIQFNWQVIFRFWPVILILIGANFLFSRDDSAKGGYISLVLTLLVLGFITYQGITSKSEGFFWSHKDDYDTDDPQESASNIFTEPYNDSISKAVLNISGGATKYVIEDTTSSLFQADVRKNFGNYSLLSTNSDSSSEVSFKMKGESSWKLNDKRGNKAILRLNPKPFWDINVEMGAGTTEFDLTQFKVNKLHIQGGAASFKVKLGMPLQTTNVSVETGASKIEISIPKAAACKINVESGLSSNDFEGFIKRADGSFTTENYTNASNAIVIKMEGGLSKFEVNRY
jgi:hypothetical protein